MVDFDDNVAWHSHALYKMLESGALWSSADDLVQRMDSVHVRAWCSALTTMGARRQVYELLVSFLLAASSHFSPRRW